MTVTPVLADQLEADGVGERMLAFLRRHRVDAADRDVADAGAALRPRPRPRPTTTPARSKRLEQARRQPAAGLPGGARKGRIALMHLGRDPRRAAQARHARRAPAAGRRRPSLPRAALRRAGGLLAARVRLRRRPRGGARRARDRVHLPRPELARASGPRRCADRLPGGPVAFTIDWPTVRLVWSERRAIPPMAPTSSTTGSRRTGCASGRSRGRPTTPPPQRSARLSTPRPSWPPSATASSATAPSSGRRGLCVFAIDTELLGHWWAEGPTWLREVIEGRRARRRAPADAPAGAARARGRGARRLARPAGARERAWRPGTRPRSPTWSGPPAAASSACCARSHRRRWTAPRPCAPPASCSRCSRATGRSWTTAARPATTPTRGRRPTRRPCSRP